MIAVREGFEPSVQSNPYGSLANYWFEPLTHLTLLFSERVAKIGSRRVTAKNVRRKFGVRSLESGVGINRKAAEISAALLYIFSTPNFQLQTPDLHGSQLHFLREFHHVFTENVICIHQVLYRFAGMDHAGMVSASTIFANGF